MDIEINLEKLCKNTESSLEKQLKSGTVKIKKEGRTIKDYLVYGRDNKLHPIPTYMGYKVLNVTEDEENIIIKVGEKQQDREI